MHGLGNDRPVVGRINFNIFAIQKMDLDSPSAYSNHIEMVMHEMMHILALNENLFKFFKNK